MVSRLSVTLAILAIAIGTADAQWKVSGKPVPDTAWAKSSGDFGAQLVFTVKPEELFAAWEKPGPAVYFSEASTTERNSPIVGVIFFAGCATNADGNCDATVQFQAYTPDGESWGDRIDGELWVGKPPPDPGQMQLSVGNIGIIVESHDPLGVYKVKAVILDRIAKKTMILEREFTAIDAAKR